LRDGSGGGTSVPLPLFEGGQ